MSLPTDADCLILTDIHGAFNTLVRLLNAAPKGVQLLFSGDLIDRGPNSRAVVELAINYSIPTVCGNHEDLCLAFYNHHPHCSDMYEQGIWLCNGGDNTVRQWPVVKGHHSTPAEERKYLRDKHIGGKIPYEILDWMAALPAYIYPSTQLDSNGRRLLLSHTGYGLDADGGDWFRPLWGRHIDGDGPFRHDIEDDGLWRPIGHTSVKEAKITDTFGYIDTGAVYTSRDGRKGNLTGVLWPSKQLIVQPYDETPVTSTFTIESGGLIT